MPEFRYRLFCVGFCLNSKSVSAIIKEYIAILDNPSHVYPHENLHTSGILTSLRQIRFKTRILNSSVGKYKY